MKNIFKILALLFTMGLFVVSCENVNTEEPQVDEEISQDNALATSIVSDVFATVNNGRNNAAGKAAAVCYEAVYTPGNMTLVITYPSEGCIGLDGVRRAGVITAVFSGDSWTLGTTVTITFTNYSRDGNSLTGTIIAEHKGWDEIQNPIFNVKSQGDLTLTFENASQLVWNFNTDLTWIAGHTTLIKDDDAWRINGTASGIGRNGKTFSRTDTNLETSPTCPWFVSGTIDLIINDSDELSMEFTACGTVTFTYRGITVTKTF